MDMELKTTMIHNVKYSQRCNVSLANTEAALTQGPMLQEIFSG